MAAMRDRAALAFAPSVVKQPVFGEVLAAAVINTFPSQLLHCFVLPISRLTGNKKQQNGCEICNETRYIANVK
jgi:hypothetical protein